MPFFQLNRRLIHYFIAAAAIGVLVTAFCFANTLTPKLFAGGPETFAEAALIGLLLGSAIAQINLIALWASLVPGPWIVRLPWAMLLTLVMTSSFGVGIRSDGGSTGDVITLLIVLVSAVGLAQIPFRLLKRFRCRQLVFAPEQSVRIDQLIATDPPQRLAKQRIEAKTTSRGQFGIRSMMMATALLAISLAVFRQAFPPAEDWSLRAASIEIGDIAIVLVPMIAANLIFVVPAACHAFADRDQIGQIVLAWLPFVLLFSAIQFAFYTFAFGSPGRHVAKSFLLLVTLNAAQSVIIFLVLTILQRLGFKLQSV